MKFITLSLCLLFISIISHAQITDTALARKVSVNGFCLCQTTLPVLQAAYPDLKQVGVEEMDIPKGCMSEDARYINGEGYSTDKQPGIIFQKDKDTDYISKIRLTKQFKGNLPNGMYVDVSKLTVKDIARLYPELKDKWGSRGCSGFWNFSNDTISFYVKINLDKKPQFPIDKAYYMDKPVEGIDMVLGCYKFENHVDETTEKVAKDPILVVDSVRVDMSVINTLSPDNIAYITVVKNPAIIQKAFPGSTNSGIIYVETKVAARQLYWKYFSAKSADYADAVPSAEGDTNIQYILNGKVLKKNYEGDLALIDDETFIGIKVIGKDELNKTYGVTDKDYGVVVTTKPRAKTGK